MSADLNGVRRKLARAKKKFDALSDEVASYLDPSPFRLVVGPRRWLRTAMKSGLLGGKLCVTGERARGGPFACCTRDRI
jgi:hypothetical protein